LVEQFPRRVPQSALPVGILRDGHNAAYHPDVGLIALDYDALIVAGDDLRITVYTAEPGTQDAEWLAFAIVLGTQALIDQSIGGDAPMSGSGPQARGRL
jgi:hypothetical protein